MWSPKAVTTEKVTISMKNSAKIVKIIRIPLNNIPKNH